MSTGQDTRDPLAHDELAEFLENAKDVIKIATGLPMTADPRRVVEYWAPRLLAIPEALLAEHHTEPLFENAANCGHPEPDKTAGAAAWDAWAHDHTWGYGPDGDDTGDRNCRLTQVGEHCAGCTEWLAREYGGNDFVHPGNCLVRPVIAAALSGEETPS